MNSKPVHRTNLIIRCNEFNSVMPDGISHPYQLGQRANMCHFACYIIYCKFGNFREDFIFAKLRICEVS